MEITEQLTLLEAAQGDPAKLALLAVDLAYPAIPKVERIFLKETLAAVAIPHWCDEDILARLLPISKTDAATQLKRLRKLNVVELFPARGDGAVNVHETTRLALRKQMQQDQTEYFRMVSEHAAAHFSEIRTTAAGRIEWLYHLLIARPTQAASECDILCQEWSGQAHLQDQYALVLALKELRICELISDCIWAEIQLCVGRISQSLGLQLVGVREGLAQAKQTRLESNKLSLNSLSINTTQGPADRTAQSVEIGMGFDEHLKIARELAEKAPCTVPHEFVRTYMKIGRALAFFGRHSQAERVYEEYLGNISKLAEQYPKDAILQKFLAMGYREVSAMMWVRGNYAQAQQSLEESLGIILEPVAKHLCMVGLRLDLAKRYNRISNFSIEQGYHAYVQHLYNERLGVIRKLAKQHLENLELQRELATACSEAEDILNPQEKYTGVVSPMDEWARIIRELAKQNSDNGDLQRYLTMSYRKVSASSLVRGNYEQALESFSYLLGFLNHLPLPEEQTLDGGDLQSDFGIKRT
jgi:tetratricopeptide (TPR) repeat protein